MAPKKTDEAAAGTDALVIPGFSQRDTKLIAAAMLACTGNGKFDYEVMGQIMGTARESCRVRFSGVKKRMVDAYPTFAAFVRGGPGAGEAVKASPAKASPVKASPVKAGGDRKRKAGGVVEDGREGEGEGEGGGAEEEEKAVAKGKGRAKKPKIKEELVDDLDAVHFASDGKDDETNGASAEKTKKSNAKGAGGAKKAEHGDLDGDLGLDDELDDSTAAVYDADGESS